MPENEIYFVQFGQTSFYINKIKGCFHITWIIVTLLFFYILIYSLFETQRLKLILSMAFTNHDNLGLRSDC